MNNSEILSRLTGLAQEIIANDQVTINADTLLLGGDAMVSSRELVELLLAIEDFADSELGIKFDWASDQAMSTKRSNFRTLKTIAEYLSQPTAKKA